MGRLGASLDKAIALTAYAGEFDRQQAQQAGFQLHLSQPIDPDQLICEIATLVATISSHLNKQNF